MSEGMQELLKEVTELRATVLAKETELERIKETSKEDWEERFYKEKEKVLLLKDYIVRLSNKKMTIQILEETMLILKEIFEAKYITLYTVDQKDKNTQQIILKRALYDDLSYDSTCIPLSQIPELINRINISNTSAIQLTSIDIRNLKHKDTVSAVLGIVECLGSKQAYFLIENIDYLFHDDSTIIFFTVIMDILSTIYKSALVTSGLTKQALENLDKALTDQRTGLRNNASLQEDISTLYMDTKSTYIFADLDKFKNINDTYGHNIGDVVLVEFARRLQNTANELGGKAYRYGGEEFLIICPAELKHTVEVLEQMRVELMNYTFSLNNKEFKVTVSMGVYREKSQDELPNESIVKADKLVYKAKETGRNKIVWE